MPDVRRVGDLEIAEDMRVEGAIWSAQRIGWLLLGAFLVSATLGVFGTGPLSTTTASDGSFDVSYQRFVRRGGPSSISVTLPNVSRSATVWFEAPFLQSMQIESVSPQPDSVREQSDRVLLTFLGQDEVTVAFTVRPQQLGRQQGRVGLIDGGSVSVWQFAYP